jgi:hypothetical protein
VTRAEAAQVAAVVIGALTVLLLAGAAGLTLAVLIAGTALLMRAALRHRPRGTVHDVVTPPAQVPESTNPLPRPDDEPVAALSDEALCWAWRSSYVELQRSPGPTRLAALAVHRGACIDEIARRHPRGFDEWMASGARAGSDPTRFLRTPPTETPPSEAPPTETPLGTTACRPDDGAVPA